MVCLLLYVACDIALLIHHGKTEMIRKKEEMKEENGANVYIWPFGVIA